MMTSTAALKKIALTVVMTWSLTALAGDQVEALESWVSKSYAPLWQEEPWNNLENILGHYDSRVTVYGAEGEIEVRKASKWLGEALLAWRDDGWIGSDMTALQSRPINGTTVAFIMQWNDRYENSPDELSCSWYLANRVEGEWKFTAYADSDCPGP